MAEQEGLDELRGLVERRARSVPPPRRPRDHNDDSAAPLELRLSQPEPEPPFVEAGAERRGSADPDPPEEGPSVVRPPAAVPPAGSASVPSETLRERAAEPLPAPAQPPRRGHPAAMGLEPTANLTLRIRQSLDLRLVELLHGLRRDGVRSSKKELIEMCLSELPFEPSEQLRARLRSYRETVPKEPL